MSPGIHRRSLLGVCVLAAAVVGCPPAPTPEPPPLPFDDDDSAAIPFDDDRDLGYVSGDPVLQGRALALGTIRIDCAPGPDPDVDNEDPLAEAVARWLVTLDVGGWASVTDPARLFVWNGEPNEQGQHALAWPGRVEMSQDPTGSSAEPFEFDRWVQAIPVFEDATMAAQAGGTTLSCLDEAGAVDVARHDVMLCALDARDLTTRHCWFCGEHLGEPSTVPGDSVGRIGAPGIPGLPPLSVTAEVSCAYGPVPPDSDQSSD